MITETDLHKKNKLMNNYENKVEIFQKINN